MDFWFAGVLLLLSIVGIVLLFHMRRDKGRKAVYAIGIAGFAVLAAAMACYLLITALFVNSVP